CEGLDCGTSEVAKLVSLLASATRGVQAQVLPAAWLLYVYVADLDISVEKAVPRGTYSSPE
ncbi:MAG: hypothetical protein OSB10_01475, partial [Planctomycetota bacterium]|nr:hypothetical protein [Planctomycetota bacterium]